MIEETSIAKLQENGFIELVFLRENITLDVNEVKEGWGKAQLISPDRSKTVLLKTGKYTLLSKEAREYVMNELKTWPAVAVVVDNIGQRLMGQFIINLTGRKNKISLFDNEHKAKNWLLQK